MLHPLFTPKAIATRHTTHPWCRKRTHTRCYDLLRCSEQSRLLAAQRLTELDLQGRITCIACSRNLRLRGWSVFTVAQGCRSLEKAQLLELTCAESSCQTVGRRRRLAGRVLGRPCARLSASSSRSFLFLSLSSLTLLSLLFLFSRALLPSYTPSSFDPDTPIPSRIPFSIFTTYTFHSRDYVTSLRFPPYNDHDHPHTRPTTLRA